LVALCTVFASGVGSTGGGFLLNCFRLSDIIFSKALYLIRSDNK
jgi:hypothetical protein